MSSGEVFLDHTDLDAKEDENNQTASTDTLLLVLLDTD